MSPAVSASAHRRVYASERGTVVMTRENRDRIGRRRRMLCRCWLLVLGLLMAGPACSKKEESYDVLHLAGKVEEVDVNPDGTGELTVLYYSESQQQDVIGTGRVTPETQIIIDGVVSKLQDVRPGDQVRGEVRVEKKGEERKRIALKIYVDRPQQIGG